MRITIFTAIVTSVFAGPDPARPASPRWPTRGRSRRSSRCAPRCSCCAAASPNAKRKFRAPLPWLVGLVGIFGCLYLFISLPNRTQIFFVCAQVIGLVLYAIYGSRAAERARAAVPDGASRLRRSRFSNIIGGSAGNLVEWFDWYVYSAFALYFAHIFFPKGDATAQLLNTAAIFAVGFVMRPVGAWVMGIYADHKGRKAGLMLSVSLMCVGSLMIARRAELCQRRRSVAGDPGRGADDPGPQPRRRIWVERDLSVGNGRPRAARVLVELPICDDHRRPADRAGAARRAADHARRAGDAGLGLAHRLWRRRACSRSSSISSAAGSTRR